MPSNPPSSPGLEDKFDECFLEDKIDQIDVNNQDASTSPSTVSSPTDANMQLLPTNVNAQPTPVTSYHPPTSVDIQPPLTNIETQPQHANVNTQLTPMHITIHPAPANGNSNHPSNANTLPAPLLVIQENNEHEDHQADSQQQEIIDIDAAQGFPNMDEGRISLSFYNGT